MSILGSGNNSKEVIQCPYISTNIASTIAITIAITIVTNSRETN